MTFLIKCTVVLLIALGLSNPAYAVDKKRQERWTQWRINELKWKKQEKALDKEENSIPLENRFSKHWARMDSIEQKHSAVAALLTGIVPLEYSNKNPAIVDEGYEGVTYPEVLIIVEEHSFLEYKIPKNLEISILERHKKQSARLFKIEERFWKMSRHLLNTMYGFNMEIMELEDSAITEDIDSDIGGNVAEREFKSTGILNNALGYHLWRLNDLERGVDIMQDWLNAVKLDFGKITPKTLAADKTYKLYQTYRSNNFATKDHKWPVYTVKMNEISVFEESKEFHDEVKKQLDSDSAMINRRFKKAGKEISEDIKKTQKLINKKLEQTKKEQVKK